MKTLVISMYDFPYKFTAASYENGAITEVELSNNTVWLVHDHRWGQVPLEEVVKKIDSRYPGYDQILVCSDGEIEILK